MPVSTIHPEYGRMLPLIQTSRDACAGQPAIKAKSTRYLPAPFATDEPEAYRDFLQRAYFLDVTGRTKAAFVGMVFRKEAQLDVPAAMESIIENIDGQGQSLEQLSKETVDSTLEAGRHVLLTDYPQAPEGMDRETEQRLGLQPTISSYPAESLINWKTETVGGRKKLILAVLREEEQTGLGDEFQHETETVYRVLRLVDGVYSQALYDESGSAIIEEYTPRMAGGASFDHIPLHIAGAENNKPDMDQPPLLGLATVNISHYQTTANIEEAGWNLGQPMLSLDIGESEETWFYEANGGTPENPPKFRFGSRFSFVSKKGKAEIVQVSDSDYNVSLARMKEEQMVSIGARLIQRGGSTETAEAARINASSEASTLETLVGNCSEALEGALEDCARFMGLDPDAVTYVLNTQFFDANLSAQDLQVVIAGFQQRLYSQSVGLDMIRSGSIKLPSGLTNNQIAEQVAGELLPDDGGV